MGVYAITKRQVVRQEALWKAEIAVPVIQCGDEED